MAGPRGCDPTPKTNLALCSAVLEQLMRILLVEDDRRLADVIAAELEADHIAVDAVHDGAAGLDLGLRAIYDVVILDWMLPSYDGPAICRSLRQARVATPILMLTARDQIEDRVIGLNNGADDYLIKPFAFAELIARVRALGRRGRSATGDHNELRCGELVLDLVARTARRGRASLELTATEWRLLECLMRHPDQVLSRPQLLDYVWSYERDPVVAVVDVYISYLRRKLDQPGRADPIVTIRGVGYRLEAGRA